MLTGGITILLTALLGKEVASIVVVGWRVFSAVRSGSSLIPLLADVMRFVLKRDLTAEEKASIAEWVELRDANRKGGIPLV